MFWCLIYFVAIRKMPITISMRLQPTVLVYDDVYQQKAENLYMYIEKLEVVKMKLFFFEQLII